MNSSLLYRLRQGMALLLSGALVCTSANLAQATGPAAEAFTPPSNLPQFQLQPPAQLGQLSDYFNATGTQRPLVILIQDLHAHYGVQKNIAGLLEFLTEKMGTSTKTSLPFRLAVEGASGLVDNSVLALYPDKKVRAAATDYLLREAEITGADAFAVHRGLSQAVVGVENPNFYAVNRDLFRQSLEGRTKLVQLLDGISADLATLPRSMFARDLKAFEANQRAYREGQLSSEEWIAQLLAVPQARSLELKKNFPTLMHFVSGGQALVPEDRRAKTAQFLTQIEKQLSAEEKKNLRVLAKSESTVTYYRYLRELVYQKQLFMSVPLPLAQYLEYLHTSETSEMDRVLFEAQTLAYQIELQIAQGQSRDLVRVRHDVDLLRRVADLQATELEVRQFAPRLPEFIALSRTLLTGPNFDAPTLRRLVSAAIDYYVMAMTRNQPMVEHTLALGKTTVLVAGGFHTAPLTQILREQNVSYVVFTPAVDSLDPAYHALYLKRLSGDYLTESDILAAASERSNNFQLALNLKETRMNSLARWFEHDHPRGTLAVLRDAAFNVKARFTLKVISAVVQKAPLPLIDQTAARPNADDLDLGHARMEPQSKVLGAMHEGSDEGDQRLDALRRWLRMKNIDIEEWANAQVARMATSDKENVDQALTMIGLSENQIALVRDSIILADVPDRIRLEGKSSRLGGLIIRTAQGPKILFPKDRVVSALENKFHLADLYHEVIEIQLLKQGLSVDAAHAKAIEARNQFIAGETNTQEQFSELFGGYKRHDLEFDGFVPIFIERNIPYLAIQDIYLVDQAPRGGTVYHVTMNHGKFLFFVNGAGEIERAAIDSQTSDAFGITSLDQPRNDEKKFSLFTTQTSALLQPLFAAFMEKVKRGEFVIPDRSLEFGSYRTTNQLKGRLFFSLLNPYYTLNEFRNDFLNNVIVRNIAQRVGPKILLGMRGMIRQYLTPTGRIASAISFGGHTLYGLHSISTMDAFPLYHMDLVAHELAHEHFRILEPVVKQRIVNHFIQNRPDALAALHLAPAYSRLEEAGAADEMIAQMIGNLASGYPFVDVQDAALERHRVFISVSDVDALIGAGYLPPEFDATTEERQRFARHQGDIDLLYLSRVYPQARENLKRYQRFGDAKIVGAMHEPVVHFSDSPDAQAVTADTPAVVLRKIKNANSAALKEISALLSKGMSRRQIADAIHNYLTLNGVEIRYGFGGRVGSKGFKVVKDIDSLQELYIVLRKNGHEGINAHELLHILQVRAMMSEGLPTHLVEDPRYEALFEQPAYRFGAQVSLWTWRPWDLLVGGFGLLVYKLGLGPASSNLSRALDRPLQWLGIVPDVSVLAHPSEKAPITVISQAVIVRISAGTAAQASSYSVQGRTLPEILEHAAQAAEATDAAQAAAIRSQRFVVILENDKPRPIDIGDAKQVASMDLSHVTEIFASTVEGGSDATSKPVREERNFDYENLGYNKLSQREKDIQSAVVAQLFQTDIFKRSIANYEKGKKYWRSFAKVIPSFTFEGKNTDLTQEENDAYRLEVFINNEAYALEDTVEDPAIRNELLESFYIESARQIFLSVLRHPSGAKTYTIDRLISSIHSVFERIDAFDQPDKQKKLTQLFSDLLAESLRQLKTIPLKESEWKLPAYVTSASAFGTLSYLLSNTKGVSASLVETSFLSFIRSASEGRLKKEWVIEKFQTAEDSLLESGRVQEMAQAYLAALPELYKGVATVETESSIAKRHLIEKAETFIRAHFSAPEAAEKLAAIHHAVLPGLIQDHSNHTVSDRFGMTGVSIVMMHRTLHADTDPALLRKMYDLALQASATATDEFTRNNVRELIPALESGLLKKEENKQLLISSYGKHIEDLFFHAFRHYEDKRDYINSANIEAATSGLDFVKNRLSTLFHDPENTLWTRLLVDRLPGLIERLEPSQAQQPWLIALRHAIEGAQTTEERRAALIAHATHVREFFERFNRQAPLFRYAMTLGPVLFPTPTAITEKLSDTEKFALFDNLLTVPETTTPIDQDARFKEIYGLLLERGAFDLEKTKYFEGLASQVGYAVAFDLTQINGHRSGQLINDAQDLAQFLEENPELRQNPIFINEILRYKRISGGQHQPLSRLYRNLKTRSDDSVAYIQTLNHILESIRRPQPQTTAFDAPNEDDKLAITNFILSLNFNPAKLRAIFDIYFNSEDRETQKQIDRFELKFAQKNPAAFYDAMSNEFKTIHRQQDRKLDYNFFIPFVQNLVDAETTTVMPEAELFFKLMTSKKLHRYRSLKLGVRIKARRLSANPTKESIDLVREGLRFLDKKYQLSTLPAKWLDEKESIFGGAEDYRSYGLARELTDLLDLFSDLVAVQSAGNQTLDKNYALEWKVRLLGRLQDALNASPETFAETAASFEDGVRHFNYFFKSEKIQILHKIFEDQISTAKEDRAQNIRDLTRYVAHVALNEEGKSVIDSMLDFLQLNSERPEVVSVMYNALMQEARAGFKTWRYQSPDYQKILVDWLEANKGDAEAVEKHARIVKNWEKNQYLTTFDATGKGFIIGFTDNFSTLINIGNPANFYSCQATYKPDYNRGLAGSTSNGWNKVIAVYSADGTFVARRLVRLRLTTDGELILVREGTYGDVARDSWMDHMLAKVAHDMGVRYQPDHADDITTVELPLFAGHSVWEYSDTYGKQFTEDVGLIRTGAETPIVARITIPLVEPPASIQNDAYAPSDEAYYKLLADHIIERHEEAQPTANFRSSVPVDDFVSVGGEFFYRGVHVTTEPWEKLATQSVSEIEGTHNSIAGPLFRDPQGKLFRIADASPNEPVIAGGTIVRKWWFALPFAGLETARLFWLLHQNAAGWHFNPIALAAVTLLTLIVIHLPQYLTKVNGQRTSVMETKPFWIVAGAEVAAVLIGAAFGPLAGVLAVAGAIGVHYAVNIRVFHLANPWVDRHYFAQKRGLRFLAKLPGGEPAVTAEDTANRAPLQQASEKLDPHVLVDVQTAFQRASFEAFRGAA